MKKKLFLVVAMVALLVCLFAISVSAATQVTDPIDGLYYTVFNGDYDQTELDGSTITNFAVLDSRNKNCTLTDVNIPRYIKYNGTQYRVTEILGSQHGGAFTGNKTIVNVRAPYIINIGRLSKYFVGTSNSSSPSTTYTVDGFTIKADSGTAFSGCTSLKTVYVGASVEMISWQTFMNCTALEYVYIDRNATRYTELAMGTFMGCSKLKAIALPDYINNFWHSRFFTGCTNLQAVYLGNATNYISDGSGSTAPFSGATKTYFVNDWFSVVDENGNFYYDEEGNDVFEMPGKPAVYFVPESATYIAKEFFRYATLNDTIVFGVNTTSIDANNLLGGTGVKNVVFLGDMTKVNASGWASGITYHFMNPNDTSTSSLTWTSSSNATTVFGCDASYLTVYEKVADAACTTKEQRKFTCSCGADLGTGEYGYSLGHDYANSFLTLGENMLLSEATGIQTCQRVNGEAVCGHEITETLTPLFTYKGYSTNGKDGIVQGFSIDIEMLAIYESYLGEMDYGVVAAVDSRTDASIGADVLTLPNNLSVALSDEYNQYEHFEIMVRGIDEANADTALYLCAYVQYGGNTYYINNGTMADTVTDSTTLNSHLKTPIVVPTSLSLVENGETEYTIVYDNDNSELQAKASELASYMTEKTGVTFACVPNTEASTDDKKIVIGNITESSQTIVSTLNATNDFAIAMSEDDLVIYATSDTMYDYAFDVIYDEVLNDMTNSDYTFDKEKNFVYSTSEYKDTVYAAYYKTKNGNYTSSTILNMFEETTYTANDGTVIESRVYVPSNYDSSKNYPVILFLHGSGERGSNNTAQLKNAMPAMFNQNGSLYMNAIIVAPQCPSNQRWADNDPNNKVYTYSIDDVAQSNEITAVLEYLGEIKNTYSIDKTYGMGISMGGYGIYDIMMRHQGYFDKAVVMCSVANKDYASVLAKTPLYIVHGTSDTTAPYNDVTDANNKSVGANSAVAAIQAVEGSDVTYEALSGYSHNVWDYAGASTTVASWLLGE